MQRRTILRIFGPVTRSRGGLMLVVAVLAATVALAPAASASPRRALPSTGRAAAAARPEPALTAAAGGHLEVLLKVPPSASSQATTGVGPSPDAQTLDDFSLLVGSSSSSVGGPSAGAPVAAAGSAVAVMGVDRTSLALFSAAVDGTVYRSEWLVELIVPGQGPTAPLATYKFGKVQVSSWLLQAGPTTTTVQVTFRYATMTLNYSASKTKGISGSFTDTWNVGAAKGS